MSDFKNLQVWRKAHALALSVHRTAMSIRGAEHLSLRSQLIRSAMSIPANIVEGRSQNSQKEFTRFLRIAINSSAELEYHLITSIDLRLITRNAFASLEGQNVEVQKMLYGLIGKIIANPKPVEKRTVLM
jgi:four helix bundle protein